MEEYKKSGIDPLPWPVQWKVSEDIFEKSKKVNNADYFPLLAGQGLTLLKNEQYAAEINEEIVCEAQRNISNLGAKLEHAN